MGNELQHANDARLHLLDRAVDLEPVDLVLRHLNDEGVHLFGQFGELALEDHERQHLLDDRAYLIARLGHPDQRGDTPQEDLEL